MAEFIERIMTRDMIALILAVMAVGLSITSQVLSDTDTAGNYNNNRNPTTENIALALLSMSATVLGTEKGPRNSNILRRIRTKKAEASENGAPQIIEEEIEEETLN